MDLVRKKNQLGEWCKFFLKMLIQTAENGKDTFIRIKKLKDDMDLLALSMQKRSANVQKLINFMYQSPVIDISAAAKELNVTFPTASTLIHDLAAKGIIAPYMKQCRSQMFFFARYIEIFDEVKERISHD